MSPKNNQSWQIKVRQEELQKIADTFTEEDGIEYAVILEKKDTTPPNQLNFSFEEPRCNCSPINNY